jgi:DNA topoisomerase VI B subunit
MRAKKLRILPEIWVELTQVKADRFRVSIQDNGPGIVKKQIPLIFGKLLYGSKFHRLRMSRGQQGIGISAAGMNGWMTTGMPVKIISKTSAKKAGSLLRAANQYEEEPARDQERQRGWRRYRAWRGRARIHAAPRDRLGLSLRRAGRRDTEGSQEWNSRDH